MTSSRTIIAAAALAVASVGLPAALGQQNQNAGQARVVQQQGPEIQIPQDARPQVVVFFPQQTQGGQSQGVQVEFIESRFEQRQDEEGQQQRGPATPTGRVLVFNSDEAQNGVVSHALDQGGNMQYRVAARSGGQMLEVSQSGGGQGVQLMIVQQPPTQEETTRYEQEVKSYDQRRQQLQERQQELARADRQQGQDENGDDREDNGDNDNGGNGGENGEARQAAGQQDQQQRQQEQLRQQMEQMQSQRPQQPGPKQVAVILIYTGEQAGR